MLDINTMATLNEKHVNDTLSESTFKAISDFVKDLGDVFGDENQPIKLYSHLLSKTTLAHVEAVSKHINIFREFCANNKDSIINLNYSTFKQTKIEYSQRVYIDFSFIFNNADQDVQKAIWDHLIVISSYLENNKEVLKLMCAKKPVCMESNTKESEFLSEMVEKIQSKVNISESSNPMECISTLMSSGVIDELVTDFKENISSGKVDLGGLMGSLQGMMTNLNSELETSGTQLPFNPADMFNTLMAGMNSAGGPSAPLDFSTLLNQFNNPNNNTN